MTRDDGEAARAAELDLVALCFTSRLDWLGSVCVEMRRVRESVGRRHREKHSSIPVVLYSSEIVHGQTDEEENQQEAAKSTESGGCGTV